jgi:uncharacterized membrane protein YphA (DoxX/SURF4 family)
MTKKRIAKEIALWLVAVFLALVCLRSGLTKLPADSFWVRDFRRWQYPGWSRYAVAVAELVSCALLLVPRAATAGAALFAAVMLGAVFTHATHHESSRLPFNFLLLSLSLVVLFARRKNFPRHGTRQEVAPASRALSRDADAREADGVSVAVKP